MFRLEGTTNTPQWKERKQQSESEETGGLDQLAASLMFEEELSSCQVVSFWQEWQRRRQEWVWRSQCSRESRRQGRTNQMRRLVLKRELRSEDVLGAGSELVANIDGMGKYLKCRGRIIRWQICWITSDCDRSGLQHWWMEFNFISAAGMLS